jgi:hypothetical protein
LLSLFGDNVAMNPRSYQFFLERACVRFHGALKCTYTEITDPNVYSHDFAVGKTNVKIQGFDMSGNSYECIKTLFVYDEQPPVFTTPADERATELTHDVNATTCNVQNKDPFEEYENLGSFSATGSDNCDRNVEIVKQLFDQEGVTKLYDSREDDPHGLFTHGPGVYKLVYLAIDDYSANIDFPERRDNHETTHNVTLTLRDTTGPTQVSECPPDMNVTIGAHEIETEAGNVTWTVPEVTGDNCLHIIPPLAAEEVTGKEPGMRFPVGATRVEYIFKDGSGNAYEEECKFTVTVVQKENPVKITCPADVTVDTLEHASFALVSWPAPVATQGGAALDVVYPQGVAPGMPFPFGITDVKARAVGTLPVGQTGDLPYAECFFTVTVRDPEDPMCDHRILQCDAGSPSDAIKPYHICDGPQLDVEQHADFHATLGYETLGVLSPSYSSCCSSELGAPHACRPAADGSSTKYCQPWPPPPEAGFTRIHTVIENEEEKQAWVEAIDAEVNGLEAQGFPYYLSLSDDEGHPRADGITTLTKFLAWKAPWCTPPASIDEVRLINVGDQRGHALFYKFQPTAEADRQHKIRSEDGHYVEGTEYVDLPDSTCQQLFAFDTSDGSVCFAESTRDFIQETYVVRETGPALPTWWRTSARSSGLTSPGSPRISRRPRTAPRSSIRSPWRRRTGRSVSTGERRISSRIPTLARETTRTQVHHGTASPKLWQTLPKINGSTSRAFRKESCLPRSAPRVRRVWLCTRRKSHRNITSRLNLTVDEITVLSAGITQQ